MCFIKKTPILIQTFRIDQFDYYSVKDILSWNVHILHAIYIYTYMNK